MSDMMELIRARHSVRQYLSKAIPEELRRELDACAEALNREGGLHIQIFYDEPVCFNSRMAHYGRFESCENYIALIGKRADDLEERCGYYGEKLVLKAQELGLNTCWAALTHGKSAESAQAVSNAGESAPAWFHDGVEAALLAPTAVNQQKFRFELLDGNRVSAKAGLIGSCLKIDLGIVKCHFELGAGRDNFTWA